LIASACGDKKLGGTAEAADANPGDVSDLSKQEARRLPIANPDSKWMCRKIFYPFVRPHLHRIHGLRRDIHMLRMMAAAPVSVTVIVFDISHAPIPEYRKKPLEGRVAQCAGGIRKEREFDLTPSTTSRVSVGSERRSTAARSNSVRNSCSDKCQQPDAGRA